MENERLKGTSGKAHVGSNNRVSLLREKFSRLLPRWRKAFVKRFKRAPDEHAERVALDSGRIWDDIQIWESNGMTAVIPHKGDCTCYMCKKYPLYWGDYADAAAGLRASLDRAKAEAEKKAAEAAEKAARDEQDERASNLRATCPIPQVAMNRLLGGVIQPEAIADLFGLSEDQVKLFMWAYRRKMCPT